VVEQRTTYNDGQVRIETVFVGTKKYQRLLEENAPFTDDIPPHIVFGGAADRNSEDLTLYSRWVKSTQLALAEGRIS